MNNTLKSGRRGRVSRPTILIRRIIAGFEGCCFEASLRASAHTGVAIRIPQRQRYVTNMYVKTVIFPSYFTTIITFKL